MGKTGSERRAVKVTRYPHWRAPVGFNSLGSIPHTMMTQWACLNPRLEDLPPRPRLSDSSGTSGHRRAVRAGPVSVCVWLGQSGDEIHTICFGLSRLDFLGSFDLILIRFDLSGGCAACFVCDEPDFCLTDDNMRRVRGTDVTHVPSLLGVTQSCRDLLMVS
jgi:hypothetical protein